MLIQKPNNQIKNLHHSANNARARKRKSELEAEREKEFNLVTFNTEWKRQTRPQATKSHTNVKKNM